MKRPALTTQLFLAVLSIAVLAVVALGAAAHRSFERGFIGYLNGQALVRIEAALPGLRQAYAEHGSWEFLRDRTDAWYALVGTSLIRTQLNGSPPGAAEQAFLSSDLLGSGRRLTLLDAQRQRVIGFSTIFASSEQREIVVDGRVVGWLAMAPIQSVTDAASLRFVDGQLRASLAIGAVVTMLAALMAWWLARTLLAPVREVARATHRLAAGDYQTRVPVKGHDEVTVLAQDFNQLALALERNEQVRRDYMADVSHELRTPLAVLRGELEAMEDGVHPATPESLRLLQSEVETLSRLVHDLHELALADVGALTYRKVELDLAALLAEECAAVRRLSAERQITLEASLPGQRVMLLADELRVRQLLNNVLGNSVRYTHTGGRCEVQLKVEGGDAVLDVRDSAPGVPDELLPRLFERFFRAEGSRGRAGGGSGLGLAISRNIVQAHGGTIEARQSPLGGVWMEIRLPMAVAVTGNVSGLGTGAGGR